MTVNMRRLAHDSGDGQTIYHCPFCGSGQVIARSDNTVECEFCKTAFTVQVQPQFAAFPQTVNGMPMDVPGMPGQIGAPDGMDPMGGPPIDPSQVEDPDAGAMPPDQEQEPESPPWLRGARHQVALLPQVQERRDAYLRGGLQALEAVRQEQSR